MKIQNTKFLISVAEENKILKDDVPEIAFVGRSNVGKSSLINSLVGKKNLAKTSSTPGLTKLINYFDVDGKCRIVDLPGYGYAKTAMQHIANWAGLMESYLINSPSLKSVLVLIDCRHTPSDLDKMMLEFLNYHQIPYMIVATKVDKLAKSKVPQACSKIAKELGIRKEIVMPYSSETHFGRDALLEYINTFI